MPRRRFVLLDRDGTIIVQKHHLADPDEVELIEGAGRALRRLADAGLGLLVVTNQSVIGRGMLDMPGLAKVHHRMADGLARDGARVDGIYVCPHLPDDGCECRKPRTGLVERAARELGFDPRECFVVGDMAKDVTLGRALGATTVLVRTGYGAEVENGAEVEPDHVVDDLGAAAALIERLVV